MHIVRRSLLALSMVAVSVASTPALHASSFHSMHAMFAKTQLVQISLRNASNTDLQLRAGEEAMTLAAGKTMSLKLAAGTRIITVADSATHKAGDLVVEVSPSLSGATIAIH